MIRVIGIDCGTAIVGWAVLEKTGSQIKNIDFGEIRTSSKTMMGERLSIIFTELTNIINKYKPNQMAVEELYYFKNSKTVISVSQARGVILLSGQMGGLDLFGYTPLQVKMAVTGYGRAEKMQVQQMVTKILKLENLVKLDDAADALAIAICHLNTGIK